MAKNEVQAAPPADDEKKEGEAAAEGEAPKQSFVKKLLGNKKLLIMAGGGALVLLLAVGGGAYFLFFSGSEAKTMQMAAGEPLPVTPPNITFYDVVGREVAQGRRHQPHQAVEDDLEHREALV